MDFSDKKIVFFDIDGTLIDNETHQIPQSAIDAIRKLRENGHLAFINTGRTLVSIEKRIREIGFDGFICGCGTHVYYQDKVLFGRSIPHEKCAEVVAKLREFRAPAFLEGPNAVYYDSFNPSQNPEIERSRINFINMGSVAEFLPENPMDGDYEFDKFYCLFMPESDVEGLKEYIKDDFNGIDAGPGRLEAVPRGYSKAEGIRVLQKKFGVKLENCYAVGDSANDLEMLEAVPNSIAMGDSAEVILPLCDFHTDKVMEDGIKHALEHYGLI